MRGFWLTAVLLTSLAADDTGVTPRQKASDYPAHDNAKTALLAGAVVPSDQVKKMFSADIAKAYIVIEVAIYPEGPHPFDVDRFDFALETVDQPLHASNPHDIANPWLAQLPTRMPNVDVDTGVMVGHGTDPVTGRPTTSVGTYEGVHVSNYPRPNDPPPADPGQSAVLQKIRDMALPEGATGKPVAGYLYFRYAGKKRAPLTLNYTNDDLSVDLKFPK